MNIALWVLQAVLALLCGSGGYYKLSQAGVLAGQFGAVPGAAWRALGGLEVVLAVLLVVPAAAKWMPVLTPAAACTADSRPASPPRTRSSGAWRWP